MNYLSQVQRGVDFIEAHLDEALDLRSVSKAAGISHSHFQRTFKALTGETLKTYVRARRMAKALEVLLTTDMRILDVALGAGFESQEAFARAFKRAFGMTPSAYRSVGSRALFLKKARFDEDYLAHISEGVSHKPEIVEQKEMFVVGLRTAFYGPYSEKNNLGDKLPALWDAFIPRLAAIPGRVADERCYGVVRQDIHDDDMLEYFACTEVQGSNAASENLVSARVPASRYAVFTHRGPARNVDRTVDYIYATWLAQSDLRHTYGPDLEIYDERWHPTSDDSVMMYAIPVA